MPEQSVRAKCLAGLEKFIYIIILKSRNRDLTSIDEFIEEKKMARDLAQAIKDLFEKGE